MTLHKSNTILETSSNCTNGAICPFKVFFQGKDNMHGEKLPQITWFSLDEKMEQIACHVIGFISPLYTVKLFFFRA